MAEAQLWKDFIPILNLAKILKQITHFRKLWVFGCTLPWPLWNRNIYLSVTAKRMEEQNAYIIFFRSVEGDNWYDGSTIEKTPKTNMVTVKYGGFIIEDLGEDSQRVSACILFNPNIKDIPSWIIPYLIKSIAVVFHSQYAKRCLTLPKKNYKLIEENKLFYDHIREIIRRNTRDHFLRR